MMFQTKYQTFLRIDENLTSFTISLSGQTHHRNEDSNKPCYVFCISFVSLLVPLYINVMIYYDMVIFGGYKLNYMK